MSKNPKLDWKIGQKVLITKPKNQDEYDIYWDSYMDRFDGTIEELRKPRRFNNSYEIKDWNFHIDWLEAVNEDSLPEPPAERKLTIFEIGERDFISWETKEEFDWLAEQIGKEFSVTYQQGRAVRRNNSPVGAKWQYSSAEWYRTCYDIDGNKYGKEYPVSYFRESGAKTPAESPPQTVKVDDKVYRLATKDDIGKLCIFTDLKRLDQVIDRLRTREPEVLSRVENNQYYYYGTTGFSYAYTLMGEDMTEYTTKNRVDGSFWRLATKEDVGKNGFVTDRLRTNKTESFYDEGKLVLRPKGKWSTDRIHSEFTYAYVPVDSQKPEVVAKSPAKLPGVKEVKEEMEKFEVGQKVLITKPTVLRRSGHVSWTPSMDYLDGSIQTLKTLDKGKSSHINGWWLDHDWLTPVIETKGRYFRKATKDDIGKECHFTGHPRFDIVAVKLACFSKKYKLAEIRNDRYTDCSGINWRTALVEVFDKKPIDVQETSVKIEEQEQTKGGQKVSEFKVGQKVRISKPNNTRENPGWVPDMDCLVGGVYLIDRITKSGYLQVQGWSFLPSWVTLVEDLTDSQVGAKIEAKVEDSKETFEVKFNGQSLGTSTEAPTYGVPTYFRDPNPIHNPQLLTWTFQESKPFPTPTYHISKEILEDTINPAEKSAKPDKESKMASGLPLNPVEEKKMTLLAFASKTVRNAAWSVVDWVLITPTKNTLRPVGKVVQYSMAYAILGALAYSGWSLYQNPSWVFEKVTELSPIEIRFKGDPANEDVPISVEAKSE